MIKANVGYGKGHYIARVEGHAGFAPKGQDIVCAGVSALTMALYKAVSDFLGRDDAAYHLVETGDGCFEIEVHGVLKHSVRAALGASFTMFVRGLRQIEKEYPGYLHVEQIIFTDKDEYDDTSEQTMKIERREGKG